MCNVAHILSLIIVIKHFKNVIVVIIYSATRKCFVELYFIVLHCTDQECDIKKEIDNWGVN